MIKFTKKMLLTGLLALSPLVGDSAQICQTGTIPATTPDANFTDNTDGTVTDSKTSLMWKRCSEGQVWNGVTCNGNATRYSWQAALQQAQTLNAGGFSGYNDWRVPNLKELLSIVEGQCFDPAINLHIFPNTSNRTFWTSSPRLKQSGAVAYTVLFSWGYGTELTNDHTYQVRLVRDHSALETPTLTPCGIVGGNSTC